ncbi:MAG: hypothetical protein K0U98_06705 [Deltaproteobacteria bacterium]|nr:hypothetical protein [Deltaproteobacteria bacterium]
MTRRSTIHAAAFTIALVLAVLPALSSFGQDGYRIVVHPDVTDNSLTRGEVSDLFLKKKVEWANGTTVRPVVLKEKTIEDAFCNDVIGRSSIAVKKYWQRQIFTGRGTPPEEKLKDEEILSFVSKTPGAIGFVSPRASTAQSQVKILQLR